MSDASKHLAVGELNKILADAKEKKDNQIIFVDFFADWCHFCQIASPAVEELARTYHDVKFFKVDVDADSDAAEEFSAQSIPTVVVFKNGEEIDRLVGFPGKQAYEQMLKKVSEAK